MQGMPGKDRHLGGILPGMPAQEMGIIRTNYFLIYYFMKLFNNIWMSLPPSVRHIVVGAVLAMVTALLTYLASVPLGPNQEAILFIVGVSVAALKHWIESFDNIKP